MDAMEEPYLKKPRLDGDGAANAVDGSSAYASKDRDLAGNAPGPFISVGTQGKATPCFKFFSTSGCPYGETCHFSHYVPGGISSRSFTGYGAIGASKLLSASGYFGPPPQLSSEYKSRMCNKYDTFEGCRFGSKCHFAHSEEELPKPNGGSSFCQLDAAVHVKHTKSSTASGSQGAEGLSHREPPPPGIAAATSTGTTSTANIVINASLAGAVIGKFGVTAKQICALSGAKILIRDHGSDSSLRNVEIEGFPEQIKLASHMVREVLLNKDTLPPKYTGFGAHNYKTRMCENFAKGLCTFGDRCHFAHGGAELREPPVPV